MKFRRVCLTIQPNMFELMLDFCEHDKTKYVSRYQLLVKVEDFARHDISRLISDWLVGLDINYTNLMIVE